MVISSSYTQLVTSSIVGPMDEVSGSVPLRATLPTEVVTVSIYVTPVASSLMMWLMLMVEILGVATTPMDRVLWGASKAISDGSCVCRQAVTPAKLHGGVIGQTTANAHTGEEGLDGVRVSSRGARGLCGLPQGNQIGPPLGVGVLDGWEISPAVTTGHEGCRIFSHPKNFGSLHGQLWCIGCLRDVGRCSFQALIILLGKGHSLEHLLIREGEVVLYFFPQFLHTLSKQAWPPSSWQVNLLCPMLEGPGICYCFLLRDFSNVPAGIDGFGRWHKLLLMKTCLCRGA